MSLKRLLELAVTISLTSIFIPNPANAISFNGKCYSNPARSRITASVAGQSGNYLVSVFSGENIKTSKIKPTNINNVAFFTFDSNPSIYSIGNAVAILPTFIKGNSVIIRFRDGTTGRLIGAIGPTCAPI